MINSIFFFFITCLLLRRWLGERPFAFWIGLSVLAFAQTAQSTLWAVFALLLVQEVIARLFRRRPWRFLPLVYAAALIIMHDVFKWRVAGFSYMVLASSLDLWWRVQGETIPFKDRVFNLLSYPKAAVGPITSAREHAARAVTGEAAARIALSGILKAFVLAGLWRLYVPAPQFKDLTGVADSLWFGIWNYIHLYLEFSGACEIVAATFWVLGYGCPLNFDRPYLSLSVTEFWKRWHITLGAWIRNHIYIPLGGSRVARWRILGNLLIAMSLCGAWHGLSVNYLAWGFLQGLFLCAERLVDFEDRVRRAGRLGRAGAWLLTQTLVTLSWVVFFARF